MVTYIWNQDICSYIDPQRVSDTSPRNDKIEDIMQLISKKQLHQFTKIKAHEVCHQVATKLPQNMSHIIKKEQSSYFIFKLYLVLTLAHICHHLHHFFQADALCCKEDAKCLPFLANFGVLFRIYALFGVLLQGWIIWRWYGFNIYVWYWWWQ